MLKLTTAMLEALADQNDITYTADITLFGNNAVDFTFTEDDLIANGCQYTRDSGTDSMPLGYVYCSQFTLQVVRTDELESTDFFNAEMVVHGVYEYDDQEYPFSLGTYTLLDISTKGEIIQMIGYDGVYAADVPVSSNLKALLPLPATTVFESCCSYLGINFNADYVYNNFVSAPFDWDACNIMINALPDGTTYRQAMSAAVALFGANAFISPFDNHMYVVPVRLENSEQSLYSGGYFDSATPYASGEEIDGGTFDPWTTEDNWTVGEVIQLNDPLSHPEFPIQDIVVDGAKASEGDYRYSTGGSYLLTADISLYATGKQAIINRIGQRVAGLRFRPFELDYRSFPFADLYQKVVFEDGRLNTYASFLTQIDIMLKGITTLKCTAETPAKNNAAYASVSSRAEAAAAQAREDAAQAREDAQEALSQVDGAIDAVGLEMMRLNTLMANSMGMFETKTESPTGAITYYLHNKETLAASDTIWKMTADGFAVSTDGGATWTAGIDAQGRAVVNILAAIGIYADWIQTGQITNADGTGYWNLDTGEFVSTQDHEPTSQQDHPPYGQMEFKNGRLYLNLYLYYNTHDDVYEYRKSGSAELGVARYWGPSGIGGIPAFGGEMAFFEPNFSSKEYMTQTDAVLFFNSSGNNAPFGYTEYLLFLRTARFSKNVVFGGGMEAGQATINDLTATNKISIPMSGTGITTPSLFIWTKAPTTSSPQGDGLSMMAATYTAGSTSFKVVELNKPNKCPILIRDDYYGYTEADIANSSLYICGPVRANAAMYATGFNNTSDERKKNILKWDDRYDEIIDDLDPIIFTWKNVPDDNRNHVGVSAQRTEKALHDHGIFDSGIVTGGGEKTYTVAYNELTALLIGKVKQQQKQINDLNDRLSRIEKLLEEKAWQ